MSVALQASGWLAPIDARLAERRQAAEPREASGRIVLVDIDAASLAEIGPWPWAPEVVGNTKAAIEAAGARQVLVDPNIAKQVAATLGAGPSVSYLPSERGAVVAIPASRMGAPSLAGVLADRGGHGQIDIDFGIDPFSLPRVSFAMVAGGTVDPRFFDGKSVVVAATANELSAGVAVPVHGRLSAVELHALAAETLIAGRTGEGGKTNWPVAVATGFGLAALALAFARFGLTTLALASLAATLLVERLAFLAYREDGTQHATAFAALLAAMLLTEAVLASTRRLRRRVSRATVEADETRAMFDRVVSEAVAGIVLLRDDGTIVDANPAARLHLSHDTSGEPALPAFWHASLQKRLSREKAFEIDGRLTILQDPDADRTFEYSLVTVREGITALTFSDVTARERERRELAFHAEHDTTTGLKNRYAFRNALQNLHPSPRARVALLLDIDQFRLLNDTNGHDVGDALIVEAARRLAAAARPEDLVARLMRDQFALLIERDDEDAVLRAAQGFVATFDAPFDFAPLRLTVCASVGLRPIAEGDDPNRIFKDLDTALGEAKRTSDALVVFRPAVAEAQARRNAIEAALPGAIERGEIELAFQPQVCMEHGRITGAEALARWNSASLGPVAPDEFIPIAERSGHIVALGRAVLQAACAAAVQWPEETRLAVNVSMRQIELSDMVETVRDALARSGLPAARLEIELTESVATDGVDAYRGTITALRRVGVRIALDDFGTGYSAFARLNERLFDKVKFDRSLIVDIERNSAARTLLASLARMVEELGLDSVIEGVESERQLAIVRAARCGSVQGYHMSRPLPPGDFLDFVRSFAGERENDQLAIA